MTAARDDNAVYLRAIDAARNEVAERRLLASVLLDARDCERLDEVHADLFSRAFTRTIWVAIHGVLQRNEAVESALVGQLLIGQVDPLEYARLLDEVPSAANFPTYLDEMIKAAERRTLVESAWKVLTIHANGGSLETARHVLEAALREPKQREATLAITRMSEVETRSIDFLWRHRIARAALSIIGGDPDLGKSTITFDLIARVTRGSDWPDGAINTNGPGSAVLLSMENVPEQVVKPRLEAAGADLDRVHLITGVVMPTKRDAGFVRPLSLTDDLRSLDATLKRLKDVQLVVIDPLSCYLGATDSHIDTDVRALLGPLDLLARERRVAVVAVMHANKRQDSPAIYRLGGSVAFVAAARAVFGVAPDPNDPARRVFVPIKNNLSGERSSIAYSLVPCCVAGLADKVPKIEWHAGTLQLNPDDVFGKQERATGSNARLSGAVDWLRDRLSSGPQPAKEIEAAAGAIGIKRRTLERAKGGMDVKSTKTEAGWLWSLP